MTFLILSGRPPKNLARIDSDIYIIQITRMVIKRSAWDELKEVNDIGLKDSKR